MDMDLGCIPPLLNLNRNNADEQNKNENKYKIIDEGKKNKPPVLGSDCPTFVIECLLNTRYYIL